jgi:hypothetical protein
VCGCFAYITKHGRGPDVQILKALAVVTETRGRDAFGLAWLNAGEPIQTFKRAGAASDNLDDLMQCAVAQVVIAHCRWATHGSPKRHENNHPHQAGAGFIVHNGVIAEHATIAQEHKLDTITDCDSEVFGLLMAKFRGKLRDRAARAAVIASGNMAVLGIWANPARLLVLRDSRPLHFGETEDGIYFASLAACLPGSPAMLTDARARVLTYEGGKLYLGSTDLIFPRAAEPVEVPVTAPAKRAQTVLKYNPVAASDNVTFRHSEAQWQATVASRQAWANRVLPDIRTSKTEAKPAAKRAKVLKKLRKWNPQTKRYAR